MLERMLCCWDGTQESKLHVDEAGNGTRDLVYNGHSVTQLSSQAQHLFSILLFHKWFFRNVILLKINEWWMQVTKRFLLIQPLKPLDITNKMFSVLRTVLLQKKCFDWMSTIFQILSQGLWCFYKPISDDRNLDNLFVHFSISFNKTEHLWRFKLRDHWYL